VSTSIRLLLVAAAICAAIVPIPPRLVEEWYSRGVYPAIQRVLTPFSNLVPFALFDAAALVLLAWLGIGFWRRGRTVGWLSAISSSGIRVVTVTAVVFLLFLATWGFNYRRVPLHEQLDYDQSRITHEAALELGGHALAKVNALHASAHGTVGVGAGLERAFGSAQRILGHAQLAVPGVPKRSLLERYFRAAAIDGMTNPFFLEIILNPDALPFERPFVLAHEWAHLAGYANEAEANFVAWLACTEGDAMAGGADVAARGGPAAGSAGGRRALRDRVAHGPGDGAGGVRCLSARQSRAGGCGELYRGRAPDAGCGVARRAQPVP
jgi:hypothetical protein